MISPGDKITLKSGHEATVTRTGFPDFVGDPYPVYFQYVEKGRVISEMMLSSELRARASA